MNSLRNERGHLYLENSALIKGIEFWIIYGMQNKDWHYGGYVLNKMIYWTSVKLTAWNRVTCQLFSFMIGHLDQTW